MRAMPATKQRRKPTRAPPVLPLAPPSAASVGGACGSLLSLADMELTLIFENWFRVDWLRHARIPGAAQSMDALPRAMTTGRRAARRRAGCWLIGRATD